LSVGASGALLAFLHLLVRSVSASCLANGVQGVLVALFLWKPFAARCRKGRMTSYGWAGVLRSGSRRASRKAFHEFPSFCR